EPLACVAAHRPPPAPPHWNYTQPAELRWQSLYGCPYCVKEYIRQIDPDLRSLISIHSHTSGQSFSSPLRRYRNLDSRWTRSGPSRRSGESSIPSNHLPGAYSCLERRGRSAQTAETTPPSSANVEPPSGTPPVPMLPRHASDRISPPASISTTFIPPVEVKTL